VGLLLALIPGLLYAKAVWDMWSTVSSLPAADAIRAAVERASMGRDTAQLLEDSRFAAA
jgi:hypothetical protein